MAYILKGRHRSHTSDVCREPLYRLARFAVFRVLKTLSLSLGLVTLLANGAAAHGVTEVRGRPFHLRIPSSYDGSRPVPLVVLLHGMPVTSTYQEAYMHVGDAAEAKGVIYAFPDGTRGPVGLFWNGARCCQDPLTPPVDDVGYIGDVIDYVRRHYRLDERQIFLIGHSNGAFLASRYACERDDVAAIVTLSGGQYLDAFSCGAGRLSLRRTSVLHIHGTNDEIVGYSAPTLGQLLAYPTALITMANWRWRNGCLPPLPAPPIGQPLPDRDLDSRIPGEETSGVAYLCTGAAVEFWTIRGAPHIPTFYQTPEQSFGRVALDWLLQHGRVY
jgi:polyhydroxybutyrate depolymerase